jgi:hypothetical protein
MPSADPFDELTKQMDALVGEKGNYPRGGGWAIFNYLHL